MANGLKALRKLQLWKEVIQGTAGPATIPWRGMGVLEDMGVPVEAPEDVGVMSGVDRYYIPMVGAGLNLDAIPATFEHLPLLLECGVKAVGTGVSDGGGTGKIYTYTMPTTNPNTVRTYTIEGGDNNEKEEASHFFAEEIKLSGKSKEAVVMSSKLTGRQVVVLEYIAGTIAFVHATLKIADSANGLAGFLTGTTIKVTGTTLKDGIYTVATGGVAAEIVVTENIVNESAAAGFTIQDWFAGGPTGLTLPTLEEILFGKSKLYLDAIGGTLGATLKSNTLLGFDLTIKTGWYAVFSGDGRIDFGFIKCADPSVQLDITFEHNGTARAEKAFFRALTSRLLRLKIEGSALVTAGAYTYKTFLADLAGKWTKFSVLGEQNGNDIVTGTFTSRFNPTPAKYAEFTVVNALASL